MSPLSRNEKELAFDRCFGLTSAEPAPQVESFIAHNAPTADIHARIQAALGPLKSLHPEACPEELAERTIRLLCAIAQGVQAAGRRKITRLRLHNREDFGVCLSSNILMKSSS